MSVIKKTPLISIIIPAKNEEHYIGGLLESIKAQTYTNYEIIVADANSTDNTRAIAKAFGAKVVDGGIPSVSRNAGAQAAKGDVLLFLDADTYLRDKDFLDSLVLDFNDKNINVVVLKFKTTRLPYENFGTLKNFWGIIGASIENFYRNLEYLFNKIILGTGIFAIRKQLFIKLGGFAEDIKYGEDKDFLLKATKNSGNKKRNYKFSNKKILISFRRFTNPFVIISAWLLFIPFAVVEFVGILGAKKLRARLNNFIMSLFYGKLGGE